MLFNRRYLFTFDAPADNGAGGGDGGASKGDPEKSQTWEAYLESLPDDVKSLYETHVGGLKSALKSERDKAKDLAAKEKRLAELEEAEAKRQGEKLTEKEKLEKALAAKDAEIAAKVAALEAVQTEANQVRIRAEVRLQAQALGFADLDDVYKLADLTGVEIADGKVTGVEAALKKLAESKPYLLKSEDKKQTKGTPPGPTRKKPEDTQTQPRRPVVRF
jgi:multidrug efflux pump subunit AcrA (membrane-fusion protein)